MNDVLLNKKVSIERCLSQVESYYRQDRGIPFAEDHLRQDAIALNLQRACEAALDMANHVIRLRKLGLPQESRESFALLQRAGLIDTELCARLQAMIGFRNVLVHEYQKLNPDILVSVIEHHSQDLLTFASRMLA